MDSQSLKQAVKQRYGHLATHCGASEAIHAAVVAESFGYDRADLAAIPAEANLGLSCGNPTALASLQPGEVVVDLGAGGGIDVLLAAQRVGATGRVIGIDMAPEMIERARRNADKAGLANVEFHLAEIESLPLPTASVDCVISNCVINLVPDKGNAFREIFRVLKPGGRLAISDIVLKVELPREIQESLAAYVGCVGGAMTFDAYRQVLAEAGFDAVDLVDTHKDLNVYAAAPPSSSSCGAETAPSDATALPVVSSSCCGLSDGSSGRPLANANESGLPKELLELMRQFDANEFACSAMVFAVKRSVAEGEGACGGLGAKSAAMR